MTQNSLALVTHRGVTHCQGPETAEGNDLHTRVLTEAIATVAAHSHEESHPLLNERTDTNRVAVLVVTSDRGMAGAYSASVLRGARPIALWRSCATT